MKINSEEYASYAINQAKDALLKGDKVKTRHWASIAINLFPENEEPWLILASIGTAKAKINYLQQALSINPSNEYARQELNELQPDNLIPLKETLINEQPKIDDTAKTIITKDPNKNHKKDIHRNKKKKIKPGLLLALVPWLMSIVILCSGLFFWASFSQQWVVLAKSSYAAKPVGAVEKITSSPTPTITSTLPPSSTPTLTSTATFTPTSTFTITPIPSSTHTFIPTNTQSYYQSGIYDYPPDIGSNERWIDIDLSNQRLFAYQGNSRLKTFIVSTGTSLHPTISGQYNIWVKYRYDDMEGPGYYLPDVPYTMYYDGGYGIHGTYWHNNFGTPMSHGCVNMRTIDAEWLFNWASVGTRVNIHY